MDIDQLANDLPLCHLNLFHNLTEQSFQAQILSLKNDLLDCDDAMVMTRLMAIIASVGDAHTTLIPRVNRYLPFEFYWFAEGLHIIAAAPELQDWLGAKVMAVEDQSTEEVIAAITGILSHENQAFVMSLLPAYLSASELLYGLEICDSTENIQLTLQKSGRKFESAGCPDDQFKRTSGKLCPTGAESAGAAALPPAPRAEHLVHRCKRRTAFMCSYNACRETVGLPDDCSFCRFDGPN